MSPVSHQSLSIASEPIRCVLRWVEVFLRGIGFDFARDEERAWHQVPPYYRHPMSPRARLLQASWIGTMDRSGSEHPIETARHSPKPLRRTSLLSLSSTTAEASETRRTCRIGQSPLLEIHLQNWVTSRTNSCSRQYWLALERVRVESGHQLHRATYPTELSSRLRNSNEYKAYHNHVF